MLKQETAQMIPFDFDNYVWALKARVQKSISENCIKKKKKVHANTKLWHRSDVSPVHAEAPMTVYTDTAHTHVILPWPGHSGLD